MTSFNNSTSENLSAFTNAVFLFTKEINSSANLESFSVNSVNAVPVFDPLAVLPEELEGGGLLPEHGPGMEDGLVQGQLLGGRRGGLDQLLQGNRGGHFKKL